MLLNPFSILLVLELRRLLRGCWTVLDLGCGVTSPLRQLSQDLQLTGVDGDLDSYLVAQKDRAYDEVVLADLRNLDEVFQFRKFDACVALDVIEHLSHSEGLELIKTMEHLAVRRVILFTPNGFLEQTSPNRLFEHRSGWTAPELRALGYQVIGMLGPAVWRGPGHALVRRPKLLYGCLSLAVQLVWTRRHPERAAALLATKKIVKLFDTDPDQM